MQNKNLKIYILSNDLIFIRLIEIMFIQHHSDPVIEKMSSFNDLKKKKSAQSPDIIIMDDYILGATIPEIVRFIRFNRRMTCPVYLFCDSMTDPEKSGANKLFTKPFNSQFVAKEILKNLE